MRRQSTLFGINGRRLDLTSVLRGRRRAGFGTSLSPAGFAAPQLSARTLL